jgi:hypothetical protein
MCSQFMKHSLNGVYRSYRQFDRTPDTTHLLPLRCTTLPQTLCLPPLLHERHSLRHSLQIALGPTIRSRDIASQLVD